MASHRAVVEPRLPTESAGHLARPAQLATAGIKSLRISRERLGVEVSAVLRDLIMSGHFVPGQHLRINDIAKQLEVSTTPVREALLVLEKEGFIESESHRGFRVTTLNSADVADLFELHALIAGMLIERAAVRLELAQVKELELLDRQIRDAVRSGQGDEVEEQNFQFHRLINRSAGSVTLRRFLKETTRYVPRRYYQQIPGWLSSSAQDHAPILDALRSKDSTAARVVMEAHIRRAGSLLIEHLRSRGLWDSRPVQ